MDAPSATPVETARPKLGDRINTATRSVHTRLNKTILQRMPLALPPRADNPSVYASGLLHIAPIYLVFESMWQNLVHPDDTDHIKHPFLSPTELAAYLSNHTHAQVTTSTDSPPPVANASHIHDILAPLHFHTLLRSEALHRDLRAITGWSESELSLQLRLTASTGRLAAFLAHTKRSVARNPHVLLAYIWVLYMALFSGGRFIRASLEEAGEDFWKGKPDAIAPTGCHCEDPPASSPEEHGTARMPLSFFRFDTAEDGEDIKREFKMRLAEVEGKLTKRETEDIVQEAICVFDNMMLVVSQLDAVFSGPSPTGSTASLEDGWAAVLMPRFLETRVRDSLAVAKERGLKPISSKIVKGEGLPRRASSHDSETGVGGITTTGTSGEHAIGTMTSSKELKEKKAAEEVVSSQTPVVKTVRFGEETTFGADRDGDGRGDGGRYQPVPSVWNAALLLGVVGIVWGVGQIGRSGSIV